MAKKSSKNQPKRPTMANLDNEAQPATKTATPADTSHVNEHAPAATRLSFFNFVTIATTKDIKEFLELAATTLEGENLLYLWERAYEDGRKAVLRNLEKKLEGKYEEGVERGMDLGREEGYNVAKEGFDGIVKELKAGEAPKKPSTTDFGTQIDPPTPITTVYTLTTPKTATTTSTSVQTNPITSTAMSQARESIEYGPPALESRKISTTKAATSEISPNFAVFSSQTHSVTSSNLTTPSTTITALETRLTTAAFISKHQDSESRKFT
jgi:hypothetical protein